MHPVTPKPRRKGAVAASVLVLLSACVKSEEITLPAIDASETVTADALVAHTDYSPGLSRGPVSAISGKGKGATHAIGETAKQTIGWTRGAGLFLLPLALPIAAGVGAALAHSPEEVEAARAAFVKVGEDEDLIPSLGERVIDKLRGKSEINWSCLSIITNDNSQSCEEAKSVATLKLRPDFSFRFKGRYEADVRLHSSVLAEATLESGSPDGREKETFIAKWIYREELGSFFELTKNDAKLLRQKIKEILDQFAARIANDVYLAPRPAKVVRKTDLTSKEWRKSSFEVPEGTVVRTPYPDNIGWWVELPSAAELSSRGGHDGASDEP